MKEILLVFSSTSMHFLTNGEMKEILLAFSSTSMHFLTNGERKILPPLGTQITRAQHGKP